MYFPKLENLYNGRFKDLYLIIDALDKWLAFVPKYYIDRLTPEMFAYKQEVTLDIIYELFDELVKLGVLKQRYVLECKCGQVIKFDDSIDNVFDYIIENNESDYICSACDKHENLSTDNIFMAFKLVEKPDINYIKKNNHYMNQKDSYLPSKSLSEKIIKNPKKFIDKVGKKKLLSVGSSKVRKSISFLREE